MITLEVMESVPGAVATWSQLRDHTVGVDFWTKSLLVPVLTSSIDLER